MSEQNPSISVRVADGLEQVATKIRELSVDRAAVAITWAAVGLILLVAGITAVVWLLVGIFRALGTLLGDINTAYAVVGLVLILGGAFVWSRRYPQDRTSQQE
jgi:hypothetical protein